MMDDDDDGGGDGDDHKYYDVYYHGLITDGWCDDDDDGGGGGGDGDGDGEVVVVVACFSQAAELADHRAWLGEELETWTVQRAKSSDLL